jgi:PAS domain S-box-containing protein
MIPMPMLRVQLGVGSTRGASAVADAIRSAIDTSVVEADLARILTTGGYYSPRNIEYLTTLLQTQRRERWLMITVAVFALLLAAFAFAAARILRQRNRIHAAERALRDSERKIRLLANNISEMVLSYDMNRRLVFGNPAVEYTTGYSLHELAKQGFPCCLHPDDRSRMLDLWDTLFQGTECRDEEYRLLTKDGRTRWVVASWGPAQDESGRQVGVQGCARDITERKLAEQALRESDRSFRDLLEGVRFLAIITDLGGTITFCNDYALAITGWSREEVLGRPAKRLLEAPLQVQEAMSIETRPGEGISPFVEGALLEKSGHRRWIRWCSTPVRDSAGRIAGFASLGEDVTELRQLRAESARRESEQRFRNIADAAPLMVWVAGPDKQCTFVNKGWLLFTGRKLDQELGDVWTGAVHPDDLQNCLSVYRSGFEARRGFQMEFRKRRADGEYRWVLCTGLPQFGPGGELAGYIGSCSDITDLKRSRDEDLARQKMESVGHLAGGIAHDFNNLLGSILAQADLAMEEIADGASPRQELMNIQTVASQGADIVRQLMLYSGQETGVSEAVDVSRLAGEMLDLLKVVVSKSAVIETDFGEGLPPVKGNPAQLRQLVMNLVTNASEAIGDRGGKILIRTSRVEAETDVNGVRLEVSDSGCGIGPDLQTKIFDPFFTTKSAGHGLGLAVVQRTVQALGGSVRFETEVGRGTKFHVLLPAAVEAAALGAPAIGAAPPPQRNGNATVLLIEDESALRIAVASLLRRHDFRVIEAAEGDEALQLFREHKEAIEVILLDATLPGISSAELASRLREARPDLKVIGTSAYSRNRVEAMFPGMQMDAFIRKPYDIPELIRLMVTVIPAAEKLDIGAVAS